MSQRRIIRFLPCPESSIVKSVSTQFAPNRSNVIKINSELILAHAILKVNRAKTGRLTRPIKSSFIYAAAALGEEEEEEEEG